MASISRGTTPTITLNITNISELDPIQIFFSFKNENKKWNFSKENLTITDESIGITLDQETTLAFTPNTLVFFEAKLMLQDGTVYKTQLFNATVSDAIYDEVIRDDGTMPEVEPYSYGEEPVPMYLDDEEMSFEEEPTIEFVIGGGA